MTSIDATKTVKGIIRDCYGEQRASEMINWLGDGIYPLRDELLVLVTDGVTKGVSPDVAVELAISQMRDFVRAGINIEYYKNLAGNEDDSD